MKTFLTTAIVAASAATVTSAQSVEYLSYGAGFSQLTLEGNDLDLFGTGAALDYRNGDFLVNGAFALNRISADGDDATLTSFDVRAGYYVTPQIAVFGGITYFDFDDDDSLTTYNLGAEYTSGPFTVALSYDDSEEENYDATTSLYGSYQVTEAFEVAFGYSDTDGDNTVVLGFDYDDDVIEAVGTITESDGETLVGLAGNYDFGNSIRALASYASIDGDVDAFSIGAGYEVSQDMWIDVSVGQITDGGDTIDTIGFALTFETGRESLLIDRAQTAQVRSLGTLGDLLNIGL